jgi:5-methylthioadenosine/S-adenosylhomocysteine deaminase
VDILTALGVVCALGDVALTVLRTHVREIWNKEECVSENGESSSGGGIVLRHGTVLSMDESRRVLTDADVLVVGDRIAAVGTGLEVPPGTEEIDASGGIVMPGMIDTHRHLWQTAMRGYGADWTLT